MWTDSDSPARGTGLMRGSPPVRKNRLSEETSAVSRLNYADARDGRRIGLTLIGHMVTKTWGWA